MSIQYKATNKHKYSYERKSVRGKKRKFREFAEYINKMNNDEDLTGEEEFVDVKELLGGMMGGAAAAMNPLRGLHKAGVRVDGRDIYFEAGVDDHSVGSLKEALTEVSKKLRKKAIDDEDEPKPIRLHIKTQGGVLSDGFDAVDAIKACEVEVHTIIEGFVASAGTLMSTAGTKRFMRPNAIMLIHELRGGVWGKFSEMEEMVENMKKYMTMIEEHFLNHTKFTRSKLRTMLKKDLYLDVKDAVKFGLVDDVYKK